MSLLVDTSVLSLLLRRKSSSSSGLAEEIARILAGPEDAFALGIVFQELLTGIRDDLPFRRVERELGALGMISPTRSEFVAAARLANTCRAKGILTTTVDALLAGVASARKMGLFTADRDFERIGSVTDLRLVLIRPQNG